MFNKNFFWKFQVLTQLLRYYLLKKDNILKDKTMKNTRIVKINDFILLYKV